jgi:hypothetical protein
LSRFSSGTIKRSVENELLRGNGLPGEESGSGAQKNTRAASAQNIQPALELSKRRQTKLDLKTSASPLMRESRINEFYDALFAEGLQAEFSF